MRLLGPVIVVLAVTALLVGCAEEATPEQGSGVPPASSPTPSEAPEDDVAAITDAFERYLDAVVAMENGPSPDPALLFGIATDDVAGEHVRRAAEYQSNGIRRVGEPAVGTPDVSVDGEEARLEVCIDEDGWTAEVADGTPVTASPEGPTPRVYGFAQVDGAWLVSALVPQVEATITC